MKSNRNIIVLLLGTLIGVAYMLNSRPNNGVSTEQTKKTQKVSTQTNSQASNIKKYIHRKPAQASKTKVSKYELESDPIKKLRLLRGCYDAEGTCGFPQDDPKAEHFAIGQKIKQTLLQLEHKFHGDQSQSLELNKMARSFLAIPDGHVKEAALHLMTSQKPELKNLESILKDVIAYHDAHLIELAMLELTRYLGSEQDQKIHSALASALVTGSPFVSAQIAKGLGPFINAQSFNIYGALLEQIGRGSRTRRHLKVALEEYEKRQTAG